jgi:hypothetical protein
LKCHAAQRSAVQRASGLLERFVGAKKKTMSEGKLQVLNFKLSCGEGGGCDGSVALKKHLFAFKN